jgi:hypothetical protein
MEPVDIERYEKMLETFGRSLKTISHDETNDAYMTESQCHVVAFDDFKKEFFAKLTAGNTNVLPKSCDAFYISNTDDSWFLIEFRNGNQRQKKVDIVRKFFDSLLLLMAYFDKDMRFMRDNVHAVLVYNEEKYARIAIRSALDALERAPKLLNILPDYLAGLYCQSAEEYTETEFKDIDILNRDRNNQYIAQGQAAEQQGGAPPM